MRKYKRIKPKKSKKRVNKSIYKSNINKQNVKVNIMGSTPSLGGSISHMHIPYTVPVQTPSWGGDPPYPGFRRVTPF